MGDRNKCDVNCRATIRTLVGVFSTLVIPITYDPPGRK